MVPAWAVSATPQFDARLITLTQGIFCEVESSDSVAAPGTVAGKIDLYDYVPEFQWIGGRVPAVMGLSFGLRSVTVSDQPLQGVVISLTHPPFRGSGATQQSYVTSLGGPGPSINAYTFDLPEELVTGTWTFTANHNGREVYRASFEVVPPQAEPEIANSCGGAPMS
ncbi:DUF3859 domain-containing protein [Thalassococcus sp. BH17M4-6]|uniref:DUF3859 domain-containing protein n=1 Tax=Thalassococcus sp. BH17M4-6 TaxID=3413148 RepID=UPI003BF58171